MDNKKQELFDKLKKLSTDVTPRFIEDNQNMPVSKLKQLVEFAKKGHSLRFFGGMYSIPNAYYRLLHRLDDITPYPCLTNVKYASKEMIEELERVLIGKYDDCMYRIYAHEIAEDVRRTLYRNLIRGKNYTRDVDYGEYNDFLSRNYLSALEAGYSKQFAGGLLCWFSSHYHNTLKIAYESGVDLEKVLNLQELRDRLKESPKMMFVYKGDKAHENLDRLYNIIKRGFNPKKYEHYLLEGTVYPTMDYINLCIFTREQFIPKGNSNYKPYLQYLKHIGLPDAKLLMEEERQTYSREYTYKNYQFENNPKVKAFMNKCILKEIEFVLGIPTEKYIKMADRIDDSDLLCIIAGEDIETYRSLNLGSSLRSIYRQLLDNEEAKENLRNKSKVYGIRLYK